MFEKFSLLPEAASTVASRVDGVWWFQCAVTAFFSIGIAAALVLLCVRYRWRRNPEATPIEGSVPLELLWTGIPLGIAMLIFFWSTSVFFEINRMPADPLEITVTGKQWMWKIRHPTGQREVNSLHIPRGRPVRLTMTSEDVIHDFFVPAFRVKMDTVPGRYSQTWFEATKTGRFHLFCAEYCGTQHSLMVGEVVVMEPKDYEIWLSGQPQVPPQEAGRLLFESLRCNTCHEGEGLQRGPTLVGRFGAQAVMRDGEEVLVDEDYLRESILEPGARLVQGYEPLMPTYSGQVNEDQLFALIAYIKSLAADKEAP